MRLLKKELIVFGKDDGVFVGGRMCSSLRSWHTLYLFSKGGDPLSGFKGSKVHCEPKLRERFLGRLRRLRCLSMCLSSHIQWFVFPKEGRVHLAVLCGVSFEYRITVGSLWCFSDDRESLENPVRQERVATIVLRLWAMAFSDSFAVFLCRAEGSRGPFGPMNPKCGLDFS